MNSGYRFLFGPVRSRRLGRSLGIDLVPLKVCTYNCPYCQVGVTTDKTLDRREYVPVVDVLAEFDHWLSHDGQADVVTLAGAGEPTLHSRFGEIIEAVGARSSFRRILLSNGSLFSLPEVRVAAAKADVVKATLSAWDQTSYQAAHQPHPALQFPVFIEGLKAMRREFTGEYWLEVFVIPGVNDSREQMSRIAALAREIRPDRIHLNTAVRPAWDGSIQPAPEATLNELAELFLPRAEVVGVSAKSMSTASIVARPEEISGRLMALAQRHPCTAADMATAVGLPLGEVQKMLDHLVDSGSLRIDHRNQMDFFVVK